MADPYIGEIKMFGGNFAPVGYAFCNGALTAIDQNDALFSLIGTTYGGDGQTTFALPNLQGRIPLHQGSNLGTSFSLGQVAGTETVTLTSQQLPIHNHPMLASTSAAATGNPQNSVPAATASSNIYSPSATNGQMGNGSVGPSGGNQPHNNMMPYLCITFIIALEGVYPTQG